MLDTKLTFGVAFFMAKYSLEIRLKIVKPVLEDSISNHAADID